MALRTIAVRFNTNVSTFTSDMMSASAATRTYQRSLEAMHRAQARGNALLASGASPTDPRVVNSFARANAHAANAVNSHSRAIQGFTASAGKMAMVTGGALVLGFAAATKHAAQFEAQMRDVNAISMAVVANDLQPQERRAYDRMVNDGLTESLALTKANEMAYKRMSKTILDMSRTSAHGTKDMADTLYDIASAGIFGAKALEVLHQADIAATAGQTSMATAAEGLLAVMNAYGSAAPHVSEINDVLFQTVRVGVVRFEELSHQLGQFVGIAAVAGMAPKEWGAAIATFTRAGIPAAQAGTTLNRVLSSLINPGTALANAMKQAGIENIQTTLATEGLSGVMERLFKITGNSITEIAKLFPQFRAARGVFALATAQGQLYNDVQKEFGIGAAAAAKESALAGAASRAYAENQKALTYQLAVTKNAIGAAATEIGTNLLPVAQQAIAVIRGMAMQFGGMSDGTKKLITVVGALAGAILLFGGATMALIPRLAAMRTALTTLGLSAAAASTAMMVLTGVMAVAAIGIGIFAYTQAKGAAETAKMTDMVNGHVEAMKAEEAATLAAAQASGKYNTLMGLRRKVLDELANSNKGKNLTLMTDMGLDVSDAISSSLGEDKALVKVRDAIAKSMKVTDADFERNGIKKNFADRIQAAIESTLRGEAGGQRELRKAIMDADNMGFQSYKHDVGQYITLAGDLGKERIAQGRAVKQLTELQKAEADEVKRASATMGEHSKVVDGLRNAGLSLAQALSVEEAAIAALGSSVVTAEGNMAKLTDAQKDLQKGLQSFVDVNAIFKESLKDDEELLKGLKNGADVARDSLAAARNEARNEAEKATAAKNDELEQINRAIEDRTRDQADEIRDKAQAQADAITDRAQGGSAALRKAAANQAAAIKEAADERIEAIEEAARKEKQANSDARQKASDEAAAAADAVVISRARFEKDLRERAAAAKEYQANMAAIEEKAGPGVDVSPLLQAIQALGTDGIALAKEYASATGEQIGAAVDSLNTLEPKTKGSLDRFQKLLTDRVTKARKWRDDLFALAAMNDAETGFSGADIARTLAKEGIEGAPLVEQAVAKAKSPEGRAQLAELGSIYADAITLGSDEYAKGLDLQLQGIAAVAAKNGELAGQEFSKAIADHASITPGQAHDILRSVESELAKLDPQLSIKLKAVLDTEGAESESSEFTADRGLNGPGSSTTGSGRGNSRILPNAMGNVVRYFAQGGMVAPKENHVAQIARPSSTRRVWAEPETGGEAYIPLAMGKRKRSTDILHTVARDFGYELTRTVHNATGNIFPAGAQLMAAAGKGSGGGGGERIVVKPVLVPIQTTRQYQFGNVTGPTMADIERYAEQKSRQTALTGVPE